MLFYRLRDALRAAFAADPRTFYVRGYFVLLLLLGLCFYKDYGVSWDEQADRTNGMVSARYAVGLVAPNNNFFPNTPDIHGYVENDHGVFFEMPLALLDKVVFGIEDSRTYFLTRHFAVFVVFMMGVWALYKTARVRFRSTRVGLLASTLLVLSPRFFAESFYNGKDIVFLAFFTLGIYTLVRLLERPTWRRAVVHGLATAAAVDVRILGILLVAMTLGMLALEALFGPREPQRGRRLGQVVPVFLGAAVVGIYLGWPYLWEAPVRNFLTAFDNMKKFRFIAEVLYMGRRVSTLELPWHYAPVWIVITTPVAYTAAFVLGVLGALAALVRRHLAHLRTFAGRLDILFLGWFILPIAMVIVLHSVIYDGWRHLYFVYPALLLLAVRGAGSVWQLGRHYRWARPVALGAAVLAGGEMLYTIGRMVQAHPQEQVYFSFLSPAEVETQFERDYWALTYRQGLEWIARHDPSPQINVRTTNPGLIDNNLAIMKPEDRARFRENAPGKAQYFLGAYRVHPEPYPDSLGNEVYAVKPYGIKALTVLYKW
ncbi:glycosyltransferase family 39 protein [Hymenobacter ruricola]|uniref:Glycosyltransferase family 39 protein n=1 Tax=Hymenobacter ruricola TaxID=2791023 RepID=A0ABS0IA09_9BACT|nr:glycosyltransferase family 39 protein [Hymenobacter ruricola]MBF9223747.1 glycosyltransferase family 39 protein [Hymenobacter ruricola]